MVPLFRTREQTAKLKIPKLPVHTSTGKGMMTFFDCRGLLLVDFLERGPTINAKRYADALQKLRRTIKSKRPGMLSDGIILLHDNARPHTAYLVRDRLQRFGWETLQHPPYSPDLSPHDYHIFATQRNAFVDVGFILTR